MPYWSFAGDASRIGTAMLFLDDADRGNGTLEVVPEVCTVTACGPAAPTCVGSAAWRSIPILADGLETVAVEVPAGSVVYFGSTLVHRSAPNTSDRERRSLLLSYQPPGNKHLIDASVTSVRLLRHVSSVPRGRSKRRSRRPCGRSRRAPGRAGGQVASGWRRRGRGGGRRR